MYSKDERLEIGRRLQQIRGARDQRTFAEAVGSVQQTISKYERGEIPRSWLFLARLVEQENVDLGRLLVGYGREEARHEDQAEPGEREETEEAFAQRERVVSRF